MMSDDDIAIVGVGCRFPGADNLSEYWRVLLNGENHVKEIPKERWNVDAFYDKDPNATGKTYVRKAGFINRYDEWDHRFFGINDVEAAMIDPQQRMVLDCVHMALEDGGITRKKLSGTHTGVYIGSMNDDYKVQMMQDENSSSTYTVSGIHNSIISARVSYVYNLFGPAVTIDTACSSSLVAIHIAEQSLRLGECDHVICGGVNSMLDPAQFIPLSKARMLSPTGQCQPFSADADGYARGEGCGIVILKRLKDAIRDRNNIWGLVMTGINQDGHTASPITAPSGKQQTDLLERVYNQYHVDKDAIRVIEAHGTGTPVGDPIEANALGLFFSTRTSTKEPILIGSVKSNIGHTEAAAGVAGLIKVLLMMKYKVVVPSLMYSKHNENPSINFEQYGLSVPTQTLHWGKFDNRCRMACVNSFGFGGTNAHSVVQEYEQIKEFQKPRNKRHFPYIVVVSALDENSLEENINVFHAQLQQRHYNMNELSFTSTCNRDHRSYRKSFLADNQGHLIDLCYSYFSTPQRQNHQHVDRKVAFVFCGVGTTWNGMCKAMMHFEAFRKTLKSIDAFLLPLAGWTIESKLLEGSEVTTDALVVHISIFACQLGLVAVWNHFGVSPDVVLGQSVGEVAAAYTSGSIDLESAVNVIYFRSKCLAEITDGSMAVVKNMPVQKVREFCMKTDGTLNIAVFNSPTSCTVSGGKYAIEELKMNISQRNQYTDSIVIDLDVKCAYHSPYVDTAVTQLKNKLRNIKLGIPTVPIVSTVTGKQEPHQAFSEASYWESNTRNPVLFSDAISSVASTSGLTLFVEIGPSPVLGAHIESLLDDETTWCVVPSMKKGNETRCLAQSIGIIYEHGLDPKWENIVPQTKEITAIPQYIFRRHKTLYKSQTAELKNQGVALDSTRRSHMYLQRTANVNNNACFNATVDEATTNFVFQHIVKESYIVPGAFFADIGFEIGRACLGIQAGEATVSLEFKKPAKVDKNSKTVLAAESFYYNDNDVRFHVRQNDTVVCIGRIRKTQVYQSDEQNMDIKQATLGLTLKPHRYLTSDQIYKILRDMGFQHGPCFQVMENGITDGTRSIVEFCLPDDIIRDLDRTTIHPCVLDGMLQTTLAVTDSKEMSLITAEGLILMPIAIEDINVYRKPQKKMFAYTTRTHVTTLSTVIKLHYNIVLLNPDGAIVAKITNYTTYSRQHSSNTPDELKYRLLWRPLLQKTEDEKTSHILVIDISLDKSARRQLADDSIIVCGLGGYHPETILAFLSKTVTKQVKKRWGSFEEVHAIVVLFGRETEEQDVTSNTVHDIYQRTKNNCMTLVSFLRFFKEKEINAPLFITTQNTHRLPFHMDQGLLNLTGSEVCGFIRNLQVEFIHRKMTMVDLIPSIETTKATFLKFIRKSIGTLEDYGTEFLINHDTIFYAEFSKTDMAEITPMYRKRESINATKAQGGIFSETADCVKAPFLSPVNETTDQNNLKKSMNELLLTSICLHPSLMYPATAASVVDRENKWHSDNPEGYRVLGLEYTGFLRKRQHSDTFPCQNKPVSSNRVDCDNDMWQSVAVCPMHMQTIVNVPKDCCVSMAELPFYKPSLLTKAILYFHMIKSVPTKSSVAYVCDTQDTFSESVLTKMLAKIKSSKATSVSSVAERAVDVVLITCQFDEEKLDILAKTRRVIYLKRSIPEKLCELLAFDDDKECTEVDPKLIFQRNRIAKYLRILIPWLQKHFLKCVAPNKVWKQENGIETRRYQYSEDKIVQVVNKDGGLVLPSKASIGKLFAKSDTFLITGGLTGLGWELLLLLAEMGVGTIVTMSRSSVSSEMIQQVTDVKRKFSCNIVCFQADVSNLTSVQKTVAHIQRIPDAGRLSGVLHGAGVLDSNLLINLEEKHFERVLSPKVLGVMNLHIATKNFKLDFFVLHSSVASFVGAPSQGNYGAANTFMDAFAHWRRQQGLSAQAINWGPLEVGMAARGTFAENFRKRGYHLMQVSEIRSCFQQAIMQDSTEVVYAKMDWPVIAKEYSDRQLSRVRLLFQTLFSQNSIKAIKTESYTEVIYLTEQLLNDKTMNRQVVLERFVHAAAQRIVGSDISRLTMASTFAELGVDSMGAVTFANVVYEFTHFRMDHTFLLDQTCRLKDVVTLLYDNIVGASEGGDT